MSKRDTVLLYFILIALQRGHDMLAVVAARDRLTKAALSMFNAWDNPLGEGQMAADLVQYFFEGKPPVQWFANYVGQF